MTYYKDCGSFADANEYGGQRARLGHNVLYANTRKGSHRVYFSPGPVVIEDAINVKDLDSDKR